MSTIYLSEKKEYRALDFSKFVAAFLVAAIHIPPFEEIAPVFYRRKNNRQRQGKKISFPYYKDVCMVESVISDTDH